MSSLQLWPEQQQALEFLLTRDSAALLAEQRTGKTFITLALLEHYSQSDDFCGVLICLLNNKVSTWQTYLSEHLPQVKVFGDLVEFRKAKGPRLLLVQRPVSPVDEQLLILLSQSNHLLPKRHDTVRIIQLRRNIPPVIVPVDRHPRLRIRRRESRVWRIVPLHRQASMIARFQLQLSHKVVHGRVVAAPRLTPGQVR